MTVSRFKSPVTGAISVIAAALAIAWLWFEILAKASYWTTLHFSYSYHMMGEHLAGCCFLIVTGIAYHRWVAPIGIGRVTLRGSLFPALAVFAVYTIDYAYGKMTGQPAESWVVELLSQPFWPLVSVFFTILFLAPLGEEILFRGVLLNIFRTSRPWSIWLGAVVIAVGFAAVHPQYRNLSTLLELAALSVIFSWARLRSGGLALPVLLHSFAAVLAVIYTWLS
ncbi:TPA: CPBP family intramembrane metalloprotease [Klebsiella pneumoniae]|nr:CPBP family intramembrane metalloprotease [Klebsiella pneumoniae]